MKKLTAICLLATLCACHKERVSSNQSSSQTNNQSSSQTGDKSAGQIQSKGVWPFVKGNYWAYRDSIPKLVGH